MSAIRSDGDNVFQNIVTVRHRCRYQEIRPSSFFRSAVPRNDRIKVQHAMSRSDRRCPSRALVLICPAEPTERDGRSQLSQRSFGHIGTGGLDRTSKSELNEMSENLRKAAPNAKVQPYKYGFQASAESRYPRLLVQIKTNGRWSEKVFADMPKLPSIKPEVEQRVQSVAPAFAALNIKVGELTYDPAKRIAWLRMQFSSEDGQTVKVLSGLHPTNVGSVQVHCYALSDEFDRFAPLFSQIITSVDIDEEWKYRESNAVSRGFGRLSDLGLTGAAGGMIAFIVFRVFRRSKLVAKTANRES
jgi:hypothetical protein